MLAAVATEGTQDIGFKCRICGAVTTTRLSEADAEARRTGPGIKFNAERARICRDCWFDRGRQGRRGRVPA